MLGADPFHNTPHGEGAPIPRDPDAHFPTYPGPETDELNIGEIFDEEDTRRYEEREAAIQAARQRIELVFHGPEPANDQGRGIVEAWLIDVARIGVYEPPKASDAEKALYSKVYREYEQGFLRLPRDPENPEANAEETVRGFIKRELTQRRAAINSGADITLFEEQRAQNLRLIEQHEHDLATIQDLRKKIALHVARGYELKEFLGSRLSEEDAARAASLLSIKDIEAEAISSVPEEAPDTESDFQPSTSDRIFVELAEKIIGKRRVQWLREHLLTKRPPQSAEVAVVEHQTRN